MRAGGGAACVRLRETSCQPRPVPSPLMAWPLCSWAGTLSSAWAAARGAESWSEAAAFSAPFCAMTWAYDRGVEGDPSPSDPLSERQSRASDPGVLRAPGEAGVGGSGEAVVSMPAGWKGAGVPSVAARVAMAEVATSSVERGAKVASRTCINSDTATAAF